MVVIGVRGEIVHFTQDPKSFLCGQATAFLKEADEFAWANQFMEYFHDGLLVVDESTGRVVAVGEYAELMGEHDPVNRKSRALPPHQRPSRIQKYENALIMPGMIDAHVHYPQTEMIASYGSQLLEWLNRYTFPTEIQFSDPVVATRVSRLFLSELLKAGTTTALVFGTVHWQSMESFFTEAQRLRLRMIGGKVLQNRFCPEKLQDPTVEQGVRETQQLIDKWHNVDRLKYAVTPRFAPTSTPEQLKSAGDLLKKNPTVYLHTHLSENRREITWVKELFPERKGYLDVYDHNHFLGSRSVFAHCVWLEQHEIDRMKETNSVAVHCPTSNNFLGSGLCNIDRLENNGIRVALGTDVGAGTSFCQLRTLNEAYKVAHLQDRSLHPFQSFYMATLGSARALSLDHDIGNFEVGKEADFVVFNLHATRLLKERLRAHQESKGFRHSGIDNVADALFALLMLGDSNVVADTYVLGRRVVYDQHGDADLISPIDNGKAIPVPMPISKL